MLPVYPDCITPKSQLERIRLNLFWGGHPRIYEGLGLLEEVFGHDRAMELITYIYTADGFRSFLSEFRQAMEMQVTLNIEGAVQMLNGEQK